MSVINGANAVVGAGGAAAYEIERSLRFNSADSAYLSRTLSSSNRQTFTFNVWVKKTVVGSSTGAVLFCSTDNSTSTGWLHFNSGSYGSADTLTFEDQSSGTVLVTSQLFRDPSAWYMITLSVDTTQATASNRAKLFVNGTQVTAFSTETYPAQGANTNFNRPSSFIHTIGSQYTNNRFFNGYLTEVNFIDGQALDPTSFGEYNSNTGVWQPKEYTGSYGTNGFYLNFSDNSNNTATTLGKDYSGNGNNWTPNNFSVTAGAGNDSMVDVPTNWGTDTGAGGEVRGNYATFNSAGPPGQSGAKASFSDGNLTALFNTYDTYKPAFSTFAIPPNTGKWYFELAYSGTNLTSQNEIYYLGFTSSPLWTTYTSGVYAYILWRPGTGLRQWYSSSGNTSNSFPYLYNGDVIQLAYDSDTGKVYYGVNNTWYNSSGTGGSFSTSNQVVTVATTASLIPFVDGQNYDVASYSFTLNAGQRPFAYTAPSGFAALCTQNLPDPTIADGSTAMNAVLYTGTGSARSVTVGFPPDFTWIKVRSAAYDHQLYDIIRGAGKYLYSNSTVSEQTDINQLSSFDSNGFSLGSGVGTNESGQTFVSWNWKAGGTGVSNTDGSITSTVSANTTAGFSIVTWTNPGSTQNITVGHGLGALPSMIIVKQRNVAAASWPVWHIGLTGGASNSTYRLYLDLTNAQASASNVWGSAAPTSSVFGVGVGVQCDTGSDMVAYCFTSIPGYSAMGSYQGNGSSDGVFVFLGFRPRYVMIKLYTSQDTDNWYIQDTSRAPYNVMDTVLVANASIADADYYNIDTDFVSNGFKIRSSSTRVNGSGWSYIYMAFAENPFKYALAR